MSFNVPSSDRENILYCILVILTVRNLEMNWKECDDVDQRYKR